MRHGHQDLNVKKITFRSFRPLDGRHATIFENFPIRHIFLKFCFFKYKNEKGAPSRVDGPMTGEREPNYIQISTFPPPGIRPYYEPVVDPEDYTSLGHLVE